MEISFVLKQCLLNALLSAHNNDLIEPKEIDFVVEKPQIKEHGDYSTNIAFQISRTTNQKPIYE